MIIIQTREETTVMVNMPIKDEEEDMVHFYHECDSNESICGIVIAGLEEEPEITTMTPACPDCVELLDSPCELCGEKILVDA